MKKTIAALFGVILLASCSTGQVNPPTVGQLQTEGEWFTLTTPDGSTVQCWMYGARGNGSYGESPSWFDVDCDWSTRTP